MRAVIASDVKSIKELLAMDVDASRRDRQGDSPLSYAVTHELDEVVQVLRGAGVERLPDDQMFGPESIVHAGSQGALGTILDLLDSGVSIDFVDADGDTALTAAEAHLGVVKVLAKRGAHLSHCNNEGKTAYMIAAATKRVRMVQTLQEVGSPIDEPVALEGLAQVQAMLNALRAETSDSDAEESDGDSDTDVDGDELLMACLTGDTLTVSRQVAAGTDVNFVNDEGRTALAMAIQGLMQDEVSRRKERDFEQILDTLLAANADPEVGEFPCLAFAAMGKRLHLVNGLIRAGASVDRTIGDGQTPLFMSLLAPDAGQMADDRCALALLNAGADSALRHESGAMPIHLAAASNYLGALQALLERRPQDVDAKTNIGITPLMMAATEGHAEAVRLLLQFGADCTLKDDEGLTAKDVAIKNGNDQLIPLLG
jgi:ankyrin repeat protein